VRRTEPFQALMALTATLLGSACLLVDAASWFMWNREAVPSLLARTRRGNIATVSGGQRHSDLRSRRSFRSARRAVVMIVLWG